MVLVNKNSTMKRSNFYAIIAVGLFCIWKAVHFTATKLNVNERYLFVIKLIPGYLLIVFGCFCLGKLGYDLLTFNDYPEETQKLEEDIKEAKNDLKSRGFEQQKK